MRRYRVTYVEYDEETDKTLEMLEAMERGEVEPAEPSYKTIIAENEKEAWIKFKEWSRHIDWYVDVLHIEDEGEHKPLECAQRKDKVYRA